MLAMICISIGIFIVMLIASRLLFIISNQMDLVLDAVNKNCAEVKKFNIDFHMVLDTDLRNKLEEYIQLHSQNKDGDYVYKIENGVKVKKVIDNAY